MAPPALGIVCFRRLFEDAPSEPDLARRNAGLSAELLAGGIGFVSSTTLRGRYALRLCALNHGSRIDDVDAVLESLLHMHHNRVAGIDRDAENALRRIARHVASAWHARNRQANA